MEEEKQLLPLTITSLGEEQKVIFVDITAGVKPLIEQVRTTLSYHPKTRFSLYWAGDEVCDEVLEGLNAGDELTVGALCNEKEVKKAMMNGDLEVITRVFKAGISFTGRLIGTKRTALELALNNPEVLQHICFLGVDISHNIETNGGNTLLHLACKNGSETDIRILLRHGAKFNAVNSNGDTPLHILATTRDPDNLFDAFFSGCKTTIKINEFNKQALTPFQVACRSGNRSAAIKLADNGANIRLGSPGMYPASMRSLLRSLLMEARDPSNDILHKEALPTSREQYQGCCDPTDIKKLERSHAGKSLPRVRPTKSTYQKHVVAEVAFVPVEKDFHHSKKLPNTSYAAIARGDMLMK